MKTQFWYMQVTADKFELPLTPPMRCRDLAKYLGLDPQEIYNKTTPVNVKRYSGAKTGKRFIRFLSEELDKMEKEQ